MYNPVNCPLATCGVHVGAGIATALALLCLPAPFVLYRKGANIRKKCKYAAEAAAVLEMMDKQMREQARKKQVDGADEEEKEKEHPEADAPRDEEEAGAVTGGNSTQTSSGDWDASNPEMQDNERGYAPDTMDDEQERRKHSNDGAEEGKEK